MIMSDTFQHCVLIFACVYVSSVFVVCRLFQVIERTCVEVTSIQPSKLCVYRNATDLLLTGRGFTLNLNPSKAACRFRADSRTIGEILQQTCVLQIAQFVYVC